MGRKRHSPDGGDVDHFIERCNNQRLFRWTTALRSFYLITPYFVLQRRRPFECGVHSFDVWHHSIHSKPRVKVLSEIIPEHWLRLGGQQIEPKIGSSDRISFLGNKVSSNVE